MFSTFSRTASWSASKFLSTPRNVCNLLLQSGAWRLIFFSSRRRHTRSLCDWSSDVCSSDLFAAGTGGRRDALSVPLELAADHEQTQTGRDLSRRQLRLQTDRSNGKIFGD